MLPNFQLVYRCPCAYMHTHKHTLETPHLRYGFVVCCAVGRPRSGTRGEWVDRGADLSSLLPALLVRWAEQLAQAENDPEGQ